MHFNPGLRALAYALPVLAAVSLVACSSDNDASDSDATAATPTEAMAVADGITISEPWARATAGNPDENSAVYMVITNGADEADRLVSASVDDELASTVELHETVMQNGQMRMQPVEGWDVAADAGTLELSQGANHVMLIGLSKQLVVGDTVGLTLHFERAGDVHVDAPVREGEPMGMGSTN
ncbi:MAG: copper chaperone PCu(A)C [Dehalococcoidia bacterium]